MISKSERREDTEGTQDASASGAGTLSTNTMRTPKIITSLKGLSGRILIAGGTYDPPHLGHLEIVLKGAEKAQADIIVFMPAKKNPLKDTGPRASDEERVEMLVRMLKDHPKCVVCTYEQLLQKSPSYTVETLEEAARVVQPDAQLFLLMGGDNVKSFDKWHRFAEIPKLAKPILVARNGLTENDIDALNPRLSLEIRAAFKEGFVEAQNPISSTEVRRLLLADDFKAAEPLLHPEVLAFIRDTRLYKNIPQTGN